MAPLALTDRRAPADGVDPLEDRIIDAILECVGHWGIAKTTADDVARRAGVSRATLYRAFPGGKDVLFEATLARELGRFFDTVTAQLDEADTLEDLLVEGIVAAARFLNAHEALAYMLTHEPHLLLPSSAFQRLDRALAIATAFTAPHLRRFVFDDATAATDAEWLVRLVVSYAFNPTAALDLTDEVSVRRFLRIYVLPGLAAADADAAHPIPTP
jgi:AcrR family transcriptional regulator